jgi:predicted alpha/beta hydrolase family esterase
MAMTRQVLFVQGGGAGTHDEWDHRLVDNLTRALGDAYEVRYPQMPDEDDPAFGSWSAVLRQEITDLDDGAVVVGHSVGGTILVHTLAGGPPPTALSAVVLVAAPYVGDGGWPAEGFEPPADLGAALPSGVPVHVFHGLADDTVPASHASLYARAVPQAHVHGLPGRDHQLDDDLTEVAAVIAGLGPATSGEEAHRNPAPADGVARA